MRSALYTAGYSYRRPYGGLRERETSRSSRARFDCGGLERQTHSRISRSVRAHQADANVFSLLRSLPNHKVRFSVAELICPGGFHTQSLPIEMALIRHRRIVRQTRKLGSDHVRDESQHYSRGMWQGRCLAARFGYFTVSHSSGNYYNSRLRSTCLYRFPQGARHESTGLIGACFLWRFS